MGPRISEPVIEELPLPSDPERILYPFRHRNCPFLLQSAGVDRRLGRFSFLGWDPFIVFSNKGRVVELREGNQKRSFVSDPFKELRGLLDRFKMPPCTSFLPFTGGAVGYLGYELNHFIEELPNTTVDDLQFPEMYLCFYGRILAVDHLKERVYKVDRLQEKEPKEEREILLKTADRLPEFHPVAPVEITAPLRSNFTRSQYESIIRGAKEYIAAGDIYQVNLSQRFHCQTSSSPFHLYRRLMKVNPSPFAAYLGMGNRAILSSSPERFLLVEGDRVETRPIKGTRHRGSTQEEDERLGRELMESEKDRAELAMIVDLERNDLGRVCRYGTVQVVEEAALETYPTVLHLVATVEGRLRKDKDLVDLLRATFPGGSITGAPKVRAMEIIDEFEPTVRSAYTGSIGYIGFDGRADLNIAIRTMMMKERDVFFQVGGGIVADSDPAAEYQETLHKGEGMMRALGTEW